MLQAVSRKDKIKLTADEFPDLIGIAIFEIEPLYLWRNWIRSAPDIDAFTFE
jgi:hypothetical protein